MVEIGMKEKLVELQMQAKIGWTKDEFADHLIANGVTVQQWIPVTERLPKPYVDVITLRQDLLSRANTVGLEYITIQGIADIPAWSKDHMTWKNKVTHWMPLPQPPKES